MFKRNNNRENESKILLTALNHLGKKIIKNNNKNNHLYLKRKTDTKRGGERIIWGRKRKTDTKGRRKRE